MAEVARLNARLNSPVCKKRKRPVESADGVEASGGAVREVGGNGGGLPLDLRKQAKLYHCP